MVVTERAARLDRLAMSAAIGARSTGWIGETKPSSVRLRVLTQRTSGNRRQTWRIARIDADQHDAEDQGVEPRIGQEGGPDLPIEDEGDKPRQNQEDRHADQVDPRTGERWVVHILDFVLTRPGPI